LHTRPFYVGNKSAYKSSKRFIQPIPSSAQYHVNFFEPSRWPKVNRYLRADIYAPKAVSFFWAMFNAFFWLCNIPYGSSDHPVLQNWSKTWSAVLDLPKGKEIQGVLDKVMPKSQVIIARKP